MRGRRTPGEPQDWECSNKILLNVHIRHLLTTQLLQLEARHLGARYVQHRTHSFHQSASSLAWTQEKAGNRQAVCICFLTSFLQHFTLLGAQPRAHHQIRPIWFHIGHVMSNHKLVASNYKKKSVYLHSSGGQKPKVLTGWFFCGSELSKDESIPFLFNF